VRGQRDELVRAVRAFETSEAIGRALAGETELEGVLELVVKRSRALVEARVMVLALREDDELVIRAASGEVDRSQLGPVPGSQCCRSRADCRRRAAVRRKPSVLPVGAKFR